ncbi:sensor histidine kinase [Gottfriedia acidiceleris]|uniref:sensor histidine kinase n=1 Tax=Gottfriedia acidiceleris TaxID=371036 RepID=UPI003D211C45
MKLNSIGMKIGFTIMILFLVVLLPLGFFIDRIFLQTYTSQVHQKVNELSNNIVETLNKQHGTIPDYYEFLSLITGEEIVVFNSNGVIISNSAFGYKKGKSMPKELFSIVKMGKHFERDYYDHETNEHFIYVGRPIIQNETFQGGILVFSPINEMIDIRNWIIRSIVGAIILALGVTIFVSKRMSKPMIEMEKATREIAKGNLNTKVQIKSNDEVGSLAHAINDLSIELNNYRTNRSELLANISHELRTPISYLKGYAQLINSHKYRDIKELEDYSGIIEKESDRLAKLIQDLFELSKMEEGQIKLYIQSVDIEDIIEAVIQKVKFKAAKKNINLIFNVENELPLIISDGSRVEQIIINLIENAINYTESGEIVVTAKFIKKSIMVSIKDTGVGISDEDLPFIFDRFYRVEKSRSREMGGTGLGLAIVYELVKQLQGSITVKSEIRKGTEFLISFPEK